MVTYLYYLRAGFQRFRLFCADDILFKNVFLDVTVVGRGTTLLTRENGQSSPVDVFIFQTVQQLRHYLN